MFLLFSFKDKTYNIKGNNDDNSKQNNKKVVFSYNNLYILKNFYNKFLVFSYKPYTLSLHRRRVLTSKRKKSIKITTKNKFLFWISWRLCCNWGMETGDFGDVDDKNIACYDEDFGGYLCLWIVLENGYLGKKYKKSKF